MDVFIIKINCPSRVLSTSLSIVAAAGGRRIHSRYTRYALW